MKIPTDSEKNWLKIWKTQIDLAHDDEFTTLDEFRDNRRQFISASVYKNYILWQQKSMTLWPQAGDKTQNYAMP